MKAKRKGMGIGAKIFICMLVMFAYFCVAQYANYQAIDNLYDVASALAQEAGLDEADQKAITDTYESAVFKDISGVVLMVIITGTVMLIMLVNVMIPLKKATKEIQEIRTSMESAAVDLSRRLRVTRKDEIAIVAMGINEVLNNLENVINNVVKATGDIVDSTNIISQSVGHTTSSANRISTTIQDVSSSMEEITATVELITEDGHKVGGSVNEMASLSEQMLERAENMKMLAVETATTSKQSQENVASLIANIENAMSEAMEQSREVEKINSLTKDILKIANQTNLLALNASIEAARAGEHGRGFAVVAEEIRMLADSSKNTATSIQELSDTVIGAVDKLTESAATIMDFMSKQVVQEYKANAESGESYKKEAIDICDAMHEFIQHAKEVQDIIGSMVVKFDEINLVIEENTQGVSNATSDASTLVTLMQKVANAVKEDTVTVDILNKTVKKFKKK